MKDKLLLVGAGGLGRVTLEHTMEKYQCHFVDDSYPVGMEICGMARRSVTAWGSL